MISPEDRAHAVAVIGEAVADGATRTRACTEAGIDRRTLARWTHGADDEIRIDGRPGAVRARPCNALSAHERAALLGACHQPRFADAPPGQIVPTLADEGCYLGSESTMYRLLRQAGEQHERGRARRRSTAVPTSHSATGPGQLWSWDVTWLASPTRGIFYYLYLVVDVWSRKIVGWEVHERESGELAASLIRRTVLAERVGPDDALVLHADNGAPQRSSTLAVTLERLGISASFSRPRVSDDNAYSESLFRTAKYRPGFPVNGFAEIETAREWVLAFVRWYNGVHRHGSIRFVTPEQRHTGEHEQILAARKRLYAQAKAENPSRWSGTTRDWTAPTIVWLNPEKDRNANQDIVQETT